MLLGCGSSSTSTTHSSPGGGGSYNCEIRGASACVSLIRGALWEGGGGGGGGADGSADDLVLWATLPASLCWSIDSLLARDVTEEDACAADAALWLSPSLSRLCGSAAVAPNASRSCVSLPGFEEEAPPLFAVDDDGALCD